MLVLKNSLLFIYNTVGGHYKNLKIRSMLNSFKG